MKRDPNRSYCRYCEGYTDTYHLLMGQPMCTMCGEPKLLVIANGISADWELGRDESDPLGIDDEMRAYENDEVE